LLSVFQSRIARLGLSTPGLLIIALLIVGGTWLFIRIADEVKEGDTQHLDETVIRSMRQPGDPSQPIGPAWLEEVARDLTAMGGIAAITLITGAVVGFLWLSGKPGEMAFVLVATVGGLLLSLALKDLYHRPRPELVPHLSQVYTSSFPSGHSMLSAVVYLTQGTLLSRFVTKRRLKIYFICVAMVLTILVGISRVFMGVHYPTDVLAGWCAGLTWALLCWIVARYLRNRGLVEAN